MERFRELMTDMKVVTRATPEDKLLIVSGLQALDDQKVAIIGDGIAEIKAFTQADVSFAMGSGSSLNRNTASIVVTDDNVESVMRGFMWGRNIWLNVQRFLTFQMTCNFACLVTIVIGYCFLTESPLSAVQLIWINLVMDIIGAITLSSVVPNTEDCTQPIVADKVLHTYNYRAIYGNATWMILIMMLAIFSRTGLWDIEKYDLTTLTECSDDPDTAVDECAGAAAKKMHLTLIFTTFMFLQIFNLLNAKQINKKKLNPFTNLLF
jgi:magnesium-transporting ATPase (P-type)